MFLILQAIVLGLLQGLTEFLPVSSSGHLQGVPYLLGWESGSLTFDVMVHAGTLVAVLVYFREDLWYLATRSVGVGVVEDGEQRRAQRVVLLLAIGTVPAALAGLLFESTFEAAFGSPRAVVAFLYVTAGLLVVAELIRRRRAAITLDKDAADLVGEERQIDPGRREDAITTRDVVVIGVSQAFAIFPGISRSGATIAAGMLMGLSRAAAARFSFLLSVPIIIGATLARIPDLGTREPGTLPFGTVEIAAGVIAAGVSGYWAIRFLLRLVQTDDLLGFARYVAVFATLLLAGTFMIG
ncbi:MAG: undecaprenyl-diphosphate phosphatase [Nitriliruptor sp.]